MSDLTPEQEAACLDISQAPEPPRLLTLDQLADLPAPSYLVEDFIRAQGMTVLYGPSGGGKSFAALDWSLCIATGQPFYGQTVQQGPVVYIAAEGASGYYTRAQAWCNDRGIAEVPDFRIWIEAPNFYRGETAALQTALTGLDKPPALIVIDTLARCLIGGDENSAKDVGLFIRNAEQLARPLGSALLIVHHTGKSGELERGSSALRGAADTMLCLKPDGASLKLTCEKQKDAAEFDPWRFHLESKGESCVIRLGGDLGRLSDQEQQITETVSESFGTEWVSATKILEVSGIPKSSFYRSLKALIERNQLEERQADKRRKEYRLTPTTNTVPSSPKQSHGTAETVPSHPPLLRVGHGTDRGQE